MTTNWRDRSGEGGRGDRPRRPANRLATSWRLERRHGGAGSLFSNSEPTAPDVRRTVRVLEVDGPALVLGSTQSAPPDSSEIVKAELVRRRSGGGAVLLRPGETVWVDVVVPAGDPLWSDDVGRAFYWLGDAWVAALAEVGVAGAVHRGPLVRTRWSGDVCFAGIGAGEVVDPVASGKIVGMAARRTRSWALFQCAVPLGWDPAAYVSLLGLPAAALDDLAGVAAALNDLAGAAAVPVTGVPVTGVSADAVVDAFLTALPS